MDYKTYVQSVVASYVENKNKNFIFIKHYNTLVISKEEILACVEDKSKDTFFYHEYKMNDMHEAYAPFLDWIKESYEMYYSDSMTPGEFLLSANVYPMHIEPLVSYIKDGICRRKEDALHFEVQYEEERMLKDLFGVIEYISRNHSLVLILSKFHLAPYGTIRLLSRIMKLKSGVQTIIMYNDEFIIAGYKKKIWDQLMQEADDQNLQLEWGSLDSQRTIDIQDEFWFDKNRHEEYLSKITNMFHTFALQDAYYYLSDIIYRIDEKTIWLTKEEQMPFLKLAALTDMNMNNVNRALVLCDKMADNYSHIPDAPRLEYDYYYTCARARMIMSQLQPVKQYCGKCIEIARELGDEILECKAQIIRLSALCGIGKDIFEYDFSYQVDMETINKMSELGFSNFLAYLYIFGFENEKKTIRDIATGVREPYYFRLGVELGISLGNENMLLNAYMKNIILYSRAGYHEYVREMYKKRLEVLTRPNPVREAHMLAGLGYNSIILEDHEKATEYLIESVCTLTDLEEPDDIMNSLYNLAMNYFVGESYRCAIEVVDLIIKMLKEMGFQSIRACSTTKLYSIIAISCYYQEEYYNSYYYLSKIELVVEHMLMLIKDSDKGVWDEDLLLYHLVKGMMYSYEGSLELCQNEYDQVRKYMINTTGALFFTMPVYAVEQASLYLRQGKRSEAEKIIRYAMTYFEKEGLSKKKERMQYFLENGKKKMEPIFRTRAELPVEQILRVARQVAAQNKLVKREKDISFLTVLQEAISRENLTTEDLFQNTAAVIKNSYNLDELVILRRKDGAQTIMHEGERSPIGNNQASEIFEFFKTYKQAFLTNRVDKNFTQFVPVMKPFGVKMIMTMVGIPIIERSGTETVLLANVMIKRRSVGGRVLLNGEDLMILKFAFSQFCEMMRRIDNRIIIERMNHKLEQSAITDHLTGITNRNGFSRQVDKLCAQSNNQKNVILYLDLDNFKYYNDTFGHEIGDLVLVCFADMFKRMTYDKGLAVRYGGDEFIILLYDQNEKDAVILAEEIYREIDDGFREEIAVKLQKRINIPDDKKISCSIGISSFMGGSKDSFERALNQADRMLYYVKRHGKSKYKVYEER